MLTARRKGDRVEVVVENRTDRPLSLNPRIARHAKWYPPEGEDPVEITLGDPGPFYLFRIPAAALITLAPGNSHAFSFDLPKGFERPIRVGIYDAFEVDGDPPAPRLIGASKVEVR